MGISDKEENLMQQVETKKNPLDHLNQRHIRTSGEFLYLQFWRATLRFYQLLFRLSTRNNFITPPRASLKTNHYSFKNNFSYLPSMPLKKKKIRFLPFYKNFTHSKDFHGLFSKLKLDKEDLGLTDWFNEVPFVVPLQNNEEMGFEISDFKQSQENQNSIKSNLDKFYFPKSPSNQDLLSMLPAIKDTQVKLIKPFSNDYETIVIFLGKKNINQNDLDTIIPFFPKNKVAMLFDKLKNKQPTFRLAEETINQRGIHLKKLSPVYSGQKNRAGRDFFSPSHIDGISGDSAKIEKSFKGISEYMDIAINKPEHEKSFFSSLRSSSSLLYENEKTPSFFDMLFNYFAGFQKFDPNKQLKKEKIPIKLFNGIFKEFFNLDPLCQQLDDTNGLAEIIQKRRISALGNDGVTTINAPLAIRSIHPSFYGRLCPVDSPEGDRVGLMNSLTNYAKVTSTGFIATPFYRTRLNLILSTPRISTFDKNKIDEGKEIKMRISPSSTFFGKSYDSYSVFRKKQSFYFLKSSLSFIYSKKSSYHPSFIHSAFRTFTTETINKQIFTFKMVYGSIKPETKGALTILEKGHAEEYSNKHTDVETTFRSYSLVNEYDKRKKAFRNDLPKFYDSNYLISPISFSEIPSSNLNSLVFPKNPAIINNKAIFFTICLAPTSHFNPKALGNHVRSRAAFSANFYGSSFIHSAVFLSLFRWESKQKRENKTRTKIDTCLSRLVFFESFYPTQPKKNPSLFSLALSPFFPSHSIFSFSVQERENKNLLDTSFGSDYHNYLPHFGGDNMTPTKVMENSEERKKIIAEQNLIKSFPTGLHILNSVKSSKFFTCYFDFISFQGYAPLNSFQFFSPGVSLIPFLEHDDGTRALMGANMQRQAVPLLYAERPLVGTGLEKYITPSFSISNHSSSYFYYISGKQTKQIYSGPFWKKEPYSILAFQSDGKPHNSLFRNGLQSSRLSVSIKTERQQAKQNKKQIGKDYKTTIRRLPHLNRSRLNFSIHNSLRKTALTTFERGHGGEARKNATYKEKIISNRHWLPFRRSYKAMCVNKKPACLENSWLQKGDLLVDGSSSINGELSLGLNLFSIYMSWKGYNFEDAILISDRVANSYTSVHIEEVSVKLFKAEKVVSIVKPKSWINQGDTLIFKYRGLEDKDIYVRLANAIIDFTNISKSDFLTAVVEKKTKALEEDILKLRIKVTNEDHTDDTINTSVKAKDSNTGWLIAVKKIDSVDSDTSNLPKSSKKKMNQDLLLGSNQERNQYWFMQNNQKLNPFLAKDTMQFDRTLFNFSPSYVFMFPFFKKHAYQQANHILKILAGNITFENKYNTIFSELKKRLYSTINGHVKYSSSFLNSLYRQDKKKKGKKNSKKKPVSQTKKKQKTPKQSFDLSSQKISHFTIAQPSGPQFSSLPEKNKQTKKKTKNNRFPVLNNEQIRTKKRQTSQSKKNQSKKNQSTKEIKSRKKSEKKKNKIYNSNMARTPRKINSVAPDNSFHINSSYHELPKQARISSSRKKQPAVSQSTPVILPQKGRSEKKKKGIKTELLSSTALASGYLLKFQKLSNSYAIDKRKWVPQKEKKSAHRLLRFNFGLPHLLGKIPLNQIVFDIFSNKKFLKKKKKQIIKEYFLNSQSLSSSLKTFALTIDNNSKKFEKKQSSRSRNSLRSFSSFVPYSKGRTRSKKNRELVKFYHSSFLEFVSINQLNNQKQFFLKHCFGRTEQIRLNLNSTIFNNLKLASRQAALFATQKLAFFSIFQLSSLFPAELLRSPIFYPSRIFFKNNNFHNLTLKFLPLFCNEQTNWKKNLKPLKRRDRGVSSQTTEKKKARLKQTSQLKNKNFDSSKPSKDTKQKDEDILLAPTPFELIREKTEPVQEQIFYIAITKKLQIGDKLSGRHGNKGIVSQILPFYDMPYLIDGTPVDIVLNPLGVPSRMNVGQLFESLLGFSGFFRHEYYRIPPFDENYGYQFSRNFVYSKLNELNKFHYNSFFSNFLDTPYPKNHDTIPLKAQKTFKGTANFTLSRNFINSSFPIANKNLWNHRKHFNPFSTILEKGHISSETNHIIPKEKKISEKYFRPGSRGTIKNQHNIVQSKFQEAYISKRKPRLKFGLNPSFPGKMRLIDGQTGETFYRPIIVGKSYMLKLNHLVDHKIHSRTTGPYSLSSKQPLKGKRNFGGQRIGEMEVWSFYAFGSASLLLELLTIKSDDLQKKKQFFNELKEDTTDFLIETSASESFRVLVLNLRALCLDLDLVGQDYRIPRFYLSFLNNQNFYPSSGESNMPLSSEPENPVKLN